LCLKNAEDHLSAAAFLVGKSLNHILYHLALLSTRRSG
jgi:hypothetical protein